MAIQAIGICFLYLALNTAAYAMPDLSKCAADWVAAKGKTSQAKKAELVKCIESAKAGNLDFSDFVNFKIDSLSNKDVLAQDKYDISEALESKAFQNVVSSLKSGGVGVCSAPNIPTSCISELLQKMPIRSAKVMASYFDLAKEFNPVQQDQSEIDAASREFVYAGVLLSLLESIDPQQFYALKYKRRSQIEYEQVEMLKRREIKNVQRSREKYLSTLSKILKTHEKIQKTDKKMNLIYLDLMRRNQIAAYREFVF